MVRELERLIEGQKINLNDIKIEHEVIADKMRKRVSALEEELERYRRKYGENMCTVEQCTSTISLQPFISDQEVQVDIMPPVIVHARTPSQYSHQTKEGTTQMAYPHTIPLPENTSPNQPFEMYEQIYNNPFNSGKANMTPLSATYTT